MYVFFWIAGAPAYRPLGWLPQILQLGGKAPAANREEKEGKEDGGEGESRKVVEWVVWDQSTGRGLS